MAKKGQAAMEFLMTYGWAILVVIAAIAALAYFGVFDWSKYLPEKCDFPQSMQCLGEASIRGDTVSLSLSNSNGVNIVITAIETTTSSCNAGQAVVGVNNLNFVELNATSNVSVPNGETLKLRFQNCTLTSGSKFDEKVNVTYLHTGNGQIYTEVGEIKSKVP